MYESFCPTPLYTNNELFNNTDDWVDTIPYNESFMPNISIINRNSVNFLGLTTPGLPTALGWHSVMVSEKPSLSNYNI